MFKYVKAFPCKLGKALNTKLCYYIDVRQCSLYGCIDRYTAVINPTELVVLCSYDGEQKAISTPTQVRCGLIITIFV